MQEVTVWSTPDGSNGTQVRLCAGEALDCNRFREAFESVLHYEGNLDAILENTIWVYHCDAGALSRHFYFNSEEAIAAANKTDPQLLKTYGEQLIRKCYIQPKIYKPVSLPYVTMLERGRKGLICRMNLRPDVFGKKSAGKIYLPDKSCKEDVCIGPFVVTEVVERTNFGFVKGYMYQYEAPSDEELAQYIIKKDMHCRSVKFCSNRFGSFVLIEGTCLVKKDGEVVVSDIRPDFYDQNVVVSRHILGRDLVCQCYHSCDFSVLIEKFSQFKFDSFGSAKSIKFISKLMDDAVNYGLVSVKTMYNVAFAELNEARLIDSLDQFSRDELAEIFAVCSKMNDNANNAIQTKIKNGKIRLNMKQQGRR